MVNVVSAGHRIRFSRRSKSLATHRAEFAVNRLAPLRERNFRRFYAGYVTSLLGTSMSGVATIFAVLGSGGTAADLGYVAAAGIVPQVVFVLAGGVLADRLGRRPVMLCADALRCCAQAALAAALFFGHPRIWLFMLLAALVGTGEALFAPALDALTVQIAPGDALVSANALTGAASSATRIAGPALAGVLVALTGPAPVIAVDAASYGASMLALAMLRLPGSRPAPARPLLHQLGEGWREFAGRAWLWLTTVQFALFNLITWAPYLVLGPVLAREYLGGARAWGFIQAASGAGALLAGLGVLGRKPRRPMLAATLGTFGYPIPCLLLALRAPGPAVAAGAFLAGAGGAVFLTFCLTTMQQQVPADALARVSSFVTFGAFGLGAAGLAVAGPVAQVAGITRVLGAGAAWAVLSSAVVLMLPPTRAVRWRSGDGRGAPDAGPGHRSGQSDGSDHPKTPVS
jgi:MFS family permease